MGGSVPEHGNGPGADAGSAPVGNEVCKTCHVPYDAHKDNIYHSDCLACHTPETKHLTEDGKGSVQFPTADNCLACHKTTTTSA